MPFCIRCVPYICDIPGLISLEVSSRSNLMFINKECSDPFPSIDPLGCSENNCYLKGPAVGNINVSAYAFTKNDQDQWLGVRCFGQAQGSQTVIQKYDAFSNQHYLLYSKDNSGLIAGDMPPSVARLGIFCETADNYKAQLINGATITLKYGVEMGGNLEYYKSPLPFNMPLGDGDVYGFLGRACYMTSFDLNIDFPSPAIVNYSFQYISKCESGDCAGNPIFRIT